MSAFCHYIQWSKRLPEKCGCNHKIILRVVRLFSEGVINSLRYYSAWITDARRYCTIVPTGKKKPISWNLLAWTSCFYRFIVVLCRTSLCGPVISAAIPWKEWINNFMVFYIILLYLYGVLHNIAVSLWNTDIKWYFGIA